MFHVTGEAYIGLEFYKIVNQDKLVEHVERTRKPEGVDYGWIFGTLLTSLDCTMHNIWWGKLVFHNHALTACRPHYMHLLGEGKKHYFSDLVPNDDYYGDKPKSTGLHYLIYLASLDLTNDDGVCDLNDMLHTDNYGFSKYIMRSLLGLCEGPNGPRRAQGKGIYNLLKLFIKVTTRANRSITEFSKVGMTSPR